MESNRNHPIGPGAGHAELFLTDRLAEPIAVWCDCGIGDTHSYQQWRDRYQTSEHVPGEQAVPQ